MFCPVVGGEVLPVTPREGLARGAGRDVELIMGCNRDEWRTFFLFGSLSGTLTEEQAAQALWHLGPGQDGERACCEAFLDVSAEDLHDTVRHRLPRGDLPPPAAGPPLRHDSPPDRLTPIAWGGTRPRRRRSFTARMAFGEWRRATGRV
ncbi:hypothetical protein [Nonomuraea sp. SYSU D8015]|uniref:hypothetical protein n=1 Tax=Nonomuraea sp. SYSU D8015 TaxID=2593644 RepID=UPI001660CF09|nr:hypothetical protein [Nonomuraea sp. SYSU D8015]